MEFSHQQCRIFIGHQIFSCLFQEQRKNSCQICKVEEQMRLTLNLIYYYQKNLLEWAVDSLDGIQQQHYIIQGKIINMQETIAYCKVNVKKVKQYNWGWVDLQPINTSTIIRRRKSTTQQNSIQV